MADRKLRRGGWSGTLVLASMLAYLTAPVLEVANYSWFHHSGWESWSIRLQLALGLFGSLGGIVLATRERNLWWVLVPAGIITATILLYALILLAVHGIPH